MSYFNNIVFDVFDKGFEKVKLFCFVDNAVLIPNTDKPEVFISPTTFNVDLIVVLFNDVNPLTFNDDYNVVLLFKVVVPEPMILPLIITLPMAPCPISRPIVMLLVVFPL